MEQIFAKASSRGIVGWGAVLGICSLCIVLFGSPIFRVLGFEYSAISALLLSISVGLLSAARAATTRKISRETLGSALKLFLIPLLISLISLLFIENCAFGEGLEFYTLIAFPAAILAVAFGSAIGLMAGSSNKASWLFLVFWLATFVISLLPGYLYPQLFTYGWQYGFFPGLIWDEYIRLNSAYGWHLLEWGLLAVLLLMLATTKKREARSWAKLGAVAIAYVGLLLLRSDSGVASSHAKIETRLNSQIKTGNAIVHYYGPSLSLEERDLLKSDIEWYIHDIRAKLALRDTEHVAIYLYPDVESMYQFIGTRNASIAKPWLRELHIAIENLHSLRHELVHVLTREWASVPFYASFSTALTEGIAMAIEPSYDGMHTLHEHASAILRMKLATGVSDFMGFAGFASGASTTAYVLAGSFTKYLLDNYPIQALSEVYEWPNFEDAYNKPLSTLEQEWKLAIEPFSGSMNKFDSMRTEYYFKRTSIIHQPCLRSLGKLNHLASTSLRQHRFEDATSYYRRSYEAYPGMSAARGIVGAQLRSLQFDSARIALADPILSTHPQRLSMFISMGDLRSPTYYDTLISARLSSGHVLLAYARREISRAGHMRDDGFLRALYSSSSPLRTTVELPTQEDSAATGYWFARAYLNAQAYEDEGLISKARDYYTRAANYAEAMPESSEILPMIQLKLLALRGEHVQLPTVTTQAWINELDDASARQRFEARDQ